MKVELLSMVSGTSPAVHASMSRILESPAAGKQPDHRVPGRRAGRRHRSLGEFGHAAKAYDPPENLVSIGFQRIRRGLPLHGPSNRLHRKPNKTGGSSESRAEPDFVGLHPLIEPFAADEFSPAQCDVRESQDTRDLASQNVRHVR